jgi:hypothetical protein
LPPYYFKQKIKKEMRLLAIYHLSIKIITRGENKSAVAAAAYRAGEAIKNEYDGIVHDYSHKKGIVHTEILLTENASADYSKRAVLWNAVEKSERYCNAQLSREIEISLPVELSREQNISLARRFIKEQFVTTGMCADICVHDTGKGNPHAHVMLTMRPIEKDGKWGQKSNTVNGKKIPTVDWNDRTKAEDWRKAWEAYCNTALRINGHDIIIDHRSYERQGIEQLPTVHLGSAASQMEKRGINTERGDMNRAIEVTNSELRQLKARLDKLTEWLDGEKANENAAPTFRDILTALLDHSEEKSQHKQIRDVQTAAKVLLYMQNNDLDDIEDIRGKIGGYYAERKAINDKLTPFNRRIKTLNEHIRHSENFTKNRKIAGKRDALYAEHKRLEKQGIFFKGKAQKALEVADAFAWKNFNVLQDYDAAEKYLRGVLQKRFNPKDIPVAKWRQERETLSMEKGGLNTDYDILKDKIREVELIRKCAEEVQRAISPVTKKQTLGLEI